MALSEDMRIRTYCTRKSWPDGSVIDKTCIHGSTHHLNMLIYAMSLGTAIILSSPAKQIQVLPKSPSTATPNVQHQVSPVVQPSKPIPNACLRVTFDKNSHQAQRLRKHVGCNGPLPYNVLKLPNIFQNNEQAALLHLHFTSSTPSPSDTHLPSSSSSCPPPPTSARSRDTPPSRPRTF
jgi:hypothetical protein